LGTATIDRSVSNSGNRLIDSLVWGSKWESLGESKTTITVGYGGSATGDEIDAIEDTLAIYEKYINVDFEFVGRASDSTADIRFFFVEGEEDLLGYAFPPGEFSDEPTFNPGYSEVVISSNNYYSDGDDLKPGSIDFTTFVHEFGHAMGLAHPHDDGGTASDPSLLFPGVSQEFDDFGDYNLNQGVYTMMSYNSGWPKGSVEQTASGYGFEKGPMALDIMALQYIYGANTSYASSSTRYDLPKSNGGTTGYECIWDTGGTDTIYGSGSKSCVIDLRAATGRVEVGGGGYVSYYEGIRGGFTIARGSKIENAYGSTKNDTITGNGLANVITGGTGADTLTGGAGYDTYIYRYTKDSGIRSSSSDFILDFKVGVDTLDFSRIDAQYGVVGAQEFEFIGRETSFTDIGQVRFSHAGGNTYVYMNTDSDGAAESLVLLKGTIHLKEGDFLL
jgi:serralysin